MTIRNGVDALDATFMKPKWTIGHEASLTRADTLRSASANANALARSVLLITS